MVEQLLARQPLARLHLEAALTSTANKQVELAYTHTLRARQTRAPPCCQHIKRRQQDNNRPHFSLRHMALLTIGKPTSGTIVKQQQQHITFLFM